MAYAAAGELMPELLRELDVAPGLHPHGTRWLSAASGLVCVGQHAYVIADDERHLGHFRLDTPEPVELVELFAGDLPRDKRRRKKAKPDLECLMLLPPLAPYPHGALLALGSGSRMPRKRAALVALDPAGCIAAPPLLLDLTALYAPLQERFSDLNLEGAYVDGAALHLLQRGNKGGGNARVSYAWPAFATWLLDPSHLPPAPESIQSFELGAVDGVALTPTDAIALAHGYWIFCAVAENTDDSYEDGACRGSVIGVANAHGHIERMQALHGKPKVEGLALQPGSDPAATEHPLLLVTDDDDPALPARLLRVTLTR